MKKVLIAAALLLTACQPNPDSEECGRAYTTYNEADKSASATAYAAKGFLGTSSESLDPSLADSLRDDIDANSAALKLAEFDAIKACGERGFLEKRAEYEKFWKDMRKSRRQAEDKK